MHISNRPWRICRYQQSWLHDPYSFNFTIHHDASVVTKSDSTYIKNIRPSKECMCQINPTWYNNKTKGVTYFWKKRGSHSHESLFPSFILAFAIIFLQTQIISMYFSHCPRVHSTLTDCSCILKLFSMSLRMLMNGVAPMPRPTNNKISNFL